MSFRLNAFYRIEVYRELSDSWETEDVATTRERAIEIAKQRPVFEKARIVDFQPQTALTQRGNPIVLDEQGRVVFDHRGNKGPLYGNSAKKLQRGDRDDVRELQRRYVSLGYLDTAEVDGILGPKTAEAALKADFDGTDLIDETEQADPMDVALGNFHRKQQGG